MSGQLFIVSTPIGHLKDISLRAIETLQAVDIIYCEDTRQTTKLCSAYDIMTPLRSYHEHNAQQARPQIIKELLAGKSVALVSDAGTPLISDPGYKLVKACQENEIKIVPVPGASALLSALVISGFPCDKFYFGGFLPAKSGERIKVITENQYLPWTQIYYETANRLLESLADIEATLGSRSVCVARELTKAFEETSLGTAGEVADYYQSRGHLKGELVLLIHGYQDNKESMSDEEEEVLKLLVQHWPTKKAATVLSQITKLPKSLVYAKALELKDE